MPVVVGVASIEQRRITAGHTGTGVGGRQSSGSSFEALQKHRHTYLLYMYIYVCELGLALL